MTYYFNFESALGGYKGFNGIHIKQHLPPLKPHYHYIDNSLQRRGIILSPRFSPTLSSANLRTNDSIPSAMSLTYNRLNFPQKFSSYNAQKCINLLTNSCFTTYMRMVSFGKKSDMPALPNYHVHQD